MTEYKNNKQYLKQNSPKLKTPTPQQQAFSAFIQKITQQGLKGQDFRTARENFLSSNFSSDEEATYEKEREEWKRIERSFDIARELRGY